MTCAVARSRRARPRRPSRAEGPLHLNAPPVSVLGWSSLFPAVGILGVAVAVLHIASQTLGASGTFEDQVQIMDAAPVVRTVVRPPKPAPPPPDPDQHARPLPHNSVAAAAPVFGIPDAATSPGGDLSVAVGNTLMKPADPVVQRTPPPLSAAPVQLDRQPAILNQVMPEYPAWAEEQGVTATVQLQVTIDAGGQVQSVAIVDSKASDFTRNAIKAVKATRFQPCVKDGVAVPARFLFTYRYTL